MSEDGRSWSSQDLLDCSIGNVPLAASISCSPAFPPRRDRDSLLLRTPALNHPSRSLSLRSLRHRSRRATTRPGEHGGSEPIELHPLGPGRRSSDRGSLGRRSSDRGSLGRTSGEGIARGAVEGDNNKRMAVTHATNVVRSVIHHFPTSDDLGAGLPPPPPSSATSAAMIDAARGAHVATDWITAVDGSSKGNEGASLRGSSGSGRASPVTGATVTAAVAGRVMSAVAAVDPSDASATAADDSVPDSPTSKSAVNPMNEVQQRMLQEHLGQLLMTDQLWHRYKVGRQVWDCVITLLLAFCVLQYPYRLAFEPHMHAAAWTFAVLIDLLFVADVVAHFFFPRRKLTGEYVSRREDIARLYLRGWFVMDALSAIPWDIFTLIAVGPNGSSFALALLRMTRLLRLFHIAVRVRQWEMKLNIKGAWIGFSKLGVSILMWIHLFGCTAWLIARRQNFADHTWVAQAGLVNANAYTKYVASMYWAVNTFLDSPPDPGNNAERLFGIVSMLFSLCIISFMTAMVVAFYQELDGKRSELQSRLDHVKRYLQYRKIPRSIGHAVLAHFRYKGLTRYYDFDEPQLLAELSPALRTATALHLKATILTGWSVLDQCDASFVTALVVRLRQEVVQKGDHIVLEGDVATNLYFMTEGSAVVVAQGKIVGRLGRGAMFGENALFQEDSRRMASIIATTLCNMMYLSRSDFVALLEMHPAYKPLFQSYASDKLDQYRAALAKTVTREGDELAALVDEMEEMGLKDILVPRRYRFRVYEYTVQGKQLTAWLLDHGIAVNMVNAVATCQALIDEDFLVPLGGRTQFDPHLAYAFDIGYDDGITEEDEHDPASYDEERPRGMSPGRRGAVVVVADSQDSDEGETVAPGDAVSGGDGDGDGGGDDAAEADGADVGDGDVVPRKHKAVISKIGSKSSDGSSSPHVSSRRSSRGHVGTRTPRLPSSASIGGLEASRKRKGRKKGHKGAKNRSALELGTAISVGLQDVVRATTKASIEASDFASRVIPPPKREAEDDGDDAQHEA